MVQPRHGVAIVGLVCQRTILVPFLHSFIIRLVPSIPLLLLHLHDVAVLPAPSRRRDGDLQSLKTTIARCIIALVSVVVVVAASVSKQILVIRGNLWKFCGKLINLNEMPIRKKIDLKTHMHP